LATRLAIQSFILTIRLMLTSIRRSWRRTNKSAREPELAYRGLPDPSFKLWFLVYC
jgi:hypothetical protein